MKMYVVAVVGLIAIGAATAAQAGETGKASRRPASIARNPDAFASKRLQRTVPLSPDWAVGMDAASKTQALLSLRPELGRPEFIGASAATVPPVQRDESYFRDNLWVVRERE